MERVAHVLVGSFGFQHVRARLPGSFLSGDLIGFVAGPRLKGNRPCMPPACSRVKQQEYKTNEQIRANEARRSAFWVPPSFKECMCLES